MSITNFNNYRNNVYPYVYEYCFGSKITYYKCVTDMYVYLEIKKLFYIPCYK